MAAVVRVLEADSIRDLINDYLDAVREGPPHDRQAQAYEATGGYDRDVLVVAGVGGEEVSVGTQHRRGAGAWRKRGARVGRVDALPGGAIGVEPQAS